VQVLFILVLLLTNFAQPNPVQHIKRIACRLLHHLVAGDSADAQQLERAVPARQHDGHGIIMAWVAVDPTGLYRSLPPLA
jgi:hypothetical protein